MKENIPADLRPIKDENVGKHQPMEYDPTNPLENSKTVFSSGVASREISPMHLLPRHGLEIAAKRYAVGLRNYGDKAFNNLSNPKPLADKEWLINRCSHAILHIYSMIEAISKDELHGAEDDAGAIAWAGLTLGEAVWYVRQTKKEAQVQNRPNPQSQTYSSSESMAREKLR